MRNVYLGSHLGEWAITLSVVLFPDRSETSLPSCRCEHTHRSLLEVDRRRRRRSHICEQSSAPADRLTSPPGSPATPDVQRLSAVSDVNRKKTRPSLERSHRPRLAPRLAGSGGRLGVLGGKQTNNNKGVAPIRGRTACIVALSEVACSTGTADTIELLLSDKEVSKTHSTHRNAHTVSRSVKLFRRSLLRADSCVRSPAWWMAEKLRAVAGNAHQGGGKQTGGTIEPCRRSISFGLVLRRLRYRSFIFGPSDTSVCL